MNKTFILIMLGGTFFTAVSQILLKQSSNIKYENKIREYLNFRVILSYGMFFLILLLNTWCYTKVEMRYGPVDRYCSLCICPSPFQTDSEGKNHQRQNSGKSDYHYRHSDLYPIARSLYIRKSCQSMAIFHFTKKVPGTLVPMALFIFVISNLLFSVCADSLGIEDVLLS